MQVEIQILLNFQCRGWGIEIDPELYKKQKDLWDQVSKRSSLSALSLASTVHRWGAADCHKEYKLISLLFADPSLRKRRSRRIIKSRRHCKQLHSHKSHEFLAKPIWLIIRMRFQHCQHVLAIFAITWSAPLVRVRVMITPTTNIHLSNHPFIQ